MGVGIRDANDDYDTSGPSVGEDLNISRTDTLKSSSISKTLKMDDLRQFFHLPIVEVAKELGMCTTLLKRICRANNIKKWPYRQIQSIAKSIQSLDMASLNTALPLKERQKFKEQVVFLQQSLDNLIEDPSTPSE